MRLTLKLPSLIPPPPEEEKATNITTNNNTINSASNEVVFNKDETEVVEEEGSAKERGRSLRPRKQVVYNQKLHRRSKSTPVKTAAVSILPLPLGELRERQELEEQLRHLESTEMETLVFSKYCNNKNSKSVEKSEEGIRFVMHKGRMIREGDYVAVRGHNERVYYAVVYDVCLNKNGDESAWADRLFRLRWLLPKTECIQQVLGNPQNILPDHFDFGPMHEGLERVENIVGVFYSPTEVPFATRWVSRYTKGLRPAPIVNVERREGLRRSSKAVMQQSGSRMMQDLEAAHMLFDLQKGQ